MDLGFDPIGDGDIAAPSSSDGTYASSFRGGSELLNTFEPSERGSSSIASTFAAAFRGYGPIANAAKIGYAVWVGEDALPDLDGPETAFSATVPFNIPVTPPVSGTKSLYVVVRKRNQHGLVSQNQQPVLIQVDSTGTLVRNPIPAPIEVHAVAFEAGHFRILAKYPTVDMDTNPADKWRIWIGTTMPDPDVDPPSKVVDVDGDTLVTTLASTYPAGDYIVLVALYRTVDTTRSVAVESDVTMPDVPDTPVPVLSGFQYP